MIAGLPVGIKSPAGMVIFFMPGLRRYTKLFRKNQENSNCSLENRQKIYDDYFYQVYKIALSMTRNTQAAEDVTQETFLIAFEKYNQLRDSTKAGAWLTSIALNIARAYFNREKRFMTMDPENISIKLQDDEPEQVLERLGQKEIAQVLIGAIHDLPPEFQDVIILKYYHDLEVKEVAELLELPQGTVKSRLSRAREKLRKILEEKESLNRKGGSNDDKKPRTR